MAVAGSARPADVRLSELGGRLGLDYRQGVGPEGLPEQYLFSPDARYRYAFARWWGTQDLGSATIWVLLNPATGDTEGRRRPTLERCITWSRGWSSTGLVIVNLFAYRATNPRELTAVSDAVGPANDEVLAALTGAGQRTMVAWGARGALRDRSRQVAPVLVDPLCLALTSRGEPRHPLYVRGMAGPRPWTPEPDPGG